MKNELCLEQMPVVELWDEKPTELTWESKGQRKSKCCPFYTAKGPINTQLSSVQVPPSIGPFMKPLYQILTVGPVSPFKNLKIYSIRSMKNDVFAKQKDCQSKTANMISQHNVRTLKTIIKIFASWRMQHCLTQRIELFFRRVVYGS